VFARGEFKSHAQSIFVRASGFSVLFWFRAFCQPAYLFLPSSQAVFDIGHDTQVINASGFDSYAWGVCD
jgi:hypothetical protein